MKLKRLLMMRKKMKILRNLQITMMKRLSSLSKLKTNITNRLLSLSNLKNNIKKKKLHKSKRNSRNLNKKRTKLQKRMEVVISIQMICHQKMMSFSIKLKNLLRSRKLMLLKSSPPMKM